MIYLVIIMVLILLIIDAGIIEPNRLLIKKHVIYTDVKQPIRIVHLSDLHIHRHFSRTRLLRLIVKVNRLQPDFIVFTGDLIDHYEKSKQLRYILPLYLQAFHANTAKLAIYGNHDVGGGAKYVYRALMNEGGFQVLRNDRVIFAQAGVAFFGIDDWLTGYEDRRITEARLQPVQILLAHEPDFIDVLHMDEITMMLGGYTHVGQIRLPLLTKYHLPKGGKHYPRGVYLIANTFLSVSSGIGTTGVPFRLACPSELIFYELQPNKNNES